LFANAVLFVPVIVANYLERTNPGAISWVNEHSTAYGPNLWTDLAYAIVNICLVIGFTYFVVVSDFGGVPRELADNFGPFIFIGAAFLGIAVVVIPILEWYVSLATGRGFVMSGFDAVLVVALTVFIVRSLEQSRHRVAAPVLMSQMP
jgi:preprotein translocase subunit SecY